MASKRKSTVPCMIPSKSKHLREEIVLGCLPELLPTIPEDGILSISGQQRQQQQQQQQLEEEEDGEVEKTHKTSTTSNNAPCCKRGAAHTCAPCNFETTDLNLFLNHVDSCHKDFHTQPIFYCLNCKVSLAKFEGLALHNAKTHPELYAEGSPGKAFLQVVQRDGAVIVEQTLFTEREDLSESAISISKTPIMKMMVKGEHKKIVVSHTVEVHRSDPSADKLIVEVNGNRNLMPTTAQVLPGAGPIPVLKMPNTLGIPVMQNLRPLWNSVPPPPSPDATHELPKVMIPLSSIPTYDPAMDSSSFLKTSFGKFPYPTKAELCYLTVVSGFPEEQIKLWFTAQRLKQGISWSPEEIEDTRRKMFNTVFHPAIPKVSRRQSHHQQLSQHPRAPIQPSLASAGYAPPTAKANLTGWKGGVIVTQCATIQSSSQKHHQSVVRAPTAAVRHGIVTKETGNGLSLQKVESSPASRVNVVINHRPADKTEIGSGSCGSAGTGGSTIANKRQSGGYSEASIANLTNIVQKIDCNVNSRNANCTSKPSTSSASTGAPDKAASEAKESIDVATSSKANNDIYKSTSHSTICTKKEIDVSDHTSKARNGDSSRVICSSTGAGEFLPVLTHSLGAHPGSLLDPFLCKSKSKLSDHFEAFRRDIFQNPFSDPTKRMTSRDVALWDVSKAAYHGISAEPQLAGGGGAFFGNVSSTSFYLDDALNQPSSKPLQLDKLAPKVVLGVPQVPSSDTAIHYKDQDPAPALDEHPQPSTVVMDTPHIVSNASKERENGEKQKSKTSNAFYTAVTEEQSRTASKNEGGNNATAAELSSSSSSSLKHYLEKGRWDDDVSYPEPKIDAKTPNEEKPKSEAKRKLTNVRHSSEDDGSAYENGPSKRQHTPAREHFHQSDTKRSHRQDHQTHCRGLRSEQAKQEYLNSERQSVFQNLDAQVSVKTAKKRSMEEEEEEEESPAPIPEKSPAKDHWLIKDEECQQENQSRECVRGELLKV